MWRGTKGLMGSNLQTLESRKYGHELSDYEFLWSNRSKQIKDRTWILIILISVAGHWWSTFRRHNKVQLLAFLCQWTSQDYKWKCLNYLMNQWDAEVAFLTFLLKVLGNRSIDHNPHSYLSICQALPSKGSGQQRVLSSGGSFFSNKINGSCEFSFLRRQVYKKHEIFEAMAQQEGRDKELPSSQWMKRDKHCHSTGVFGIRVIRVIRTCFHDLFGLSKYLPEAASIGEWGKLLLKSSFFLLLIPSDPCALRVLWTCLLCSFQSKNASLEHFDHGRWCVHVMESLRHDVWRV